MNLADAQVHIAERLAAIAFPFADHPAQVAWCREGLRSGLLERHAMTEMLARGCTVDAIAHDCGVIPLRVYHHLSRWPGAETAGHDEWRLVDAPEEAA